MSTISKSMRVEEEVRIPDAVDVVEPGQVENTIEAKQIGDRIRRLRMKRSMGLVELGKKTGLSASFLSQLETGRVVPTVRNLARIAITFGKDLSYFFRDEQPITFRILRQSERVRLQKNAGTVPSFLSENLSGLIADSSMVPCIAEFRGTEEEVTFRPRIFEGVEFTMVVEGTLTLVSEMETRTLECGDVAWLDAMRKRQYTCDAGERARAIIITRPNRN
jgi:transcriptional regulator with XRE-family HTH domain